MVVTPCAKDEKINHVKHQHADPRKRPNRRHAPPIFEQQHAAPYAHSCCAHRGSSGNSVLRLTKAHEKQSVQVVRAFDIIPNGTNERKKRFKKMRSACALSRIRHTSHISGHAQRTHLRSARHGCQRTCARGRQSKRANHTEKKTKACMLNIFAHRDVRTPTSQNNYSVAAAWDSEEACSLKLTV